MPSKRLEPFRTIDEIAQITLLGQRLAERERYLSDYACNDYADRLALIDLILELYADELTDEEKEELLIIRERLRREGRALWIQYSDILTNLAIAVGKTTPRISLKGIKDELEAIKKQFNLGGEKR